MARPMQFISARTRVVALATPDAPDARLLLVDPLKASPSRAPIAASLRCLGRGPPSSPRVPASARFRQGCEGSCGGRSRREARMHAASVNFGDTRMVQLPDRGRWKYCSEVEGWTDLTNPAGQSPPLARRGSDTAGRAPDVAAPTLTGRLIRPAPATPTRSRSGFRSPRTRRGAALRPRPGRAPK